MNEKKDEMQIDDVLDTILQRNMDELHPKDDEEEDERAAHRERMMVQRAKKEEKDRILLADENIEVDPFAVEDKILEETAAEIEEDEDAAEEEIQEVRAATITDEDGDVRVIEVPVGDEEDSKFTQKDLMSMLMYVGVILVLTFCIVHFVGQRTRVSGSSMEATLSDGDNLIVDKLSYRFGDPQRFDIVIFPYQYEPDTYYIKRIIGLPGETVQIDDDGNIFINGELLEENYGKETILDPGRARNPIKLKYNEYFVLGDNRNNSSDSRFDGVANVKRDILIGKAFVRIFPFNKLTYLGDK